MRVKIRASFFILGSWFGNHRERKPWCSVRSGLCVPVPRRNIRPRQTVVVYLHNSFPEEKAPPGFAGIAARPLVTVSVCVDSGVFNVMTGGAQTVGRRMQLPCRPGDVAQNHLLLAATEVADGAGKTFGECFLCGCHRQWHQCFTLKGLRPRVGTRIFAGRRPRWHDQPLPDTADQA